jgi:phage tail sheath gpL-like
MASDAVGTERVSKVVGYKVTKGNFSETSPNLPTRIAILAEANEANQATLSLVPKQITSAKQAGDLYGYGSPIYLLARILFPFSGGGIGGVPVVVYPQAKASGSTAKVFRIVPSGVATGNGTHTLVIAGRGNLDGKNYDIAINTGDTTDIITDKIRDAINNILGSPFSAVSTDYEATLTSKWKGLTAEGLTVSVDTGGKSLGITYTVTSVAAGSGTPSVAAALAQFGNNWNTHVINSYGTVSSIMTALEQFNGIPDPDSPTGRFAAIVFKPFIALTGSVADDPSSITDSRLNDVTIAICPAPGSAGLAMEAAANACLLSARQIQDNPHLDISGRAYPDMPTPTSIGSMADYNNRDVIVQKGCSTVDLAGGKYVVQDFVTTYHPIGENPPQFRYVRNIFIDWNVQFGYHLLEAENVIDHVIAKDDDIVSASKVIKPKQWVKVLNSYFDNLTKRGLITDVPFSEDSLVVNLSSTNPDRLETFFRYKRTGYVRIASTTAEAGFNFGAV